MSLELLMLGNVPVAADGRARQARRSQRLRRVWVADERFYREVYSTLAILAQHTKPVNLGTCVTDPFARHPALTAMAIATLDEISDKRAILGVGAGISGFPSSASCARTRGGDPRDDRGRCVRCSRASWSTSTATWSTF